MATFEGPDQNLSFKAGRDPDPQAYTVTPPPPQHTFIDEKTKSCLKTVLCKKVLAISCFTCPQPHKKLNANVWSLLLPFLIIGITDKGTWTESRGHRDAERETQVSPVELGQPSASPGARRASQGRTSCTTSSLALPVMAQRPHVHVDRCGVRASRALEEEQHVCIYTAQPPNSSSPWPGRQHLCSSREPAQGH